MADTWELILTPEPTDRDLTDAERSAVLDAATEGVQVEQTVPLATLIAELESVRTDLLAHETGCEWADGQVNAAREALAVAQMMLRKAMYVRGQQ